MGKKHARQSTQSVRQTRTRTRQNKGTTLVSDPIQNTQQLNDQLRALGLYPAPTLGDGNCLFRALSDQYYGSPSQHLKLRQEICDWMEAHKTRYAPFVDDERGLDVHLRCMRQPGTYGGHLELTAFAHLKRRDVKVIQPGLVYVIEWRLGADLSPESSDERADEQDELSLSTPVKERDARRTRREKKKELKERVTKTKQAARLSRNEDDSDDENESLGPVYVAYHDWEHFSSVRNLTGPHSGIPYVVEKPATTTQAAKKAFVPGKTWNGAVSPESSLSSIESSEEEDEGEEDDEPVDSPSVVPLPVSRSPSPPPSSDTSASGSSLSIPPIPGYNAPQDSTLRTKLSLRFNRSPKRALDGADEAAEDSQGEAKRSRRNSEHRQMRDVLVEKAKLETEIDPDADTPELLSSGESSSGSSSPAATPPPSMVVVPPSPIIPEKPLTRRQRKALGLPKPRPNLNPANLEKERKASAGKIVVPGGRYKKGTSTPTTPKLESTTPEDWVKNGSGRVDVRGFKELKI